MGAEDIVKSRSRLGLDTWNEETNMHAKYGYNTPSMPRN